jgi:type I restriction enzyme, S subunit
VTENKLIRINKKKLPVNWDVAKIEEISTVILGQSPVSSSYNTTGEGLPFFQGKAEFGVFYPQTVKWCTEPKKTALKNDILISVRAPVGPTNLAPKECCIGRGLAAIRPNDGITHKYLLYYLRSIESKIESLGTGTTFKAISGGILKSLPVLLAPSNEQKRIVSEIEKQFSRLDEAVDNLKRVKANLKRYKASVLKAAVEGKLTEEWREKHPDVEPADKLLKRILAGRRKKWEEAELAKMKAKGKEPKNDKWKKKYKTPAVPLTSPRMPDLPSKWALAGIEQLLPPRRESMKTGPFGSLLKKYEHRDVGVPVLGIENIRAMKFVHGSKIHITKKKAQELDGYKVAPGDVLISRSGTVGEVCVVPDGIGKARISTNLMKVSLTKNSLFPEIFTFLFNGSPFVLNQVSELCKGSTRDFLNQDILKRIIFLVPPTSEQKQMIQEVDRTFTTIDRIEHEIKKNLLRADRLRQSILKKAFSGKLFPQINTDKSAENMLQRSA